MIVVDASVAVAWIIPTQSTPATQALLVSNADFVAPRIFAVEIRNVLLKAERRGLIVPADADRAIDNFSHAVTLMDNQSDLDELYKLARSRVISLFDAFYLDLAVRERALLASRDAMLIQAGRASGVTVQDLR